LAKLIHRVIQVTGVAERHAEIVQKVHVVWPVAQEKSQQRDGSGVFSMLQLFDDLRVRVCGLSVRCPADLNTVIVHFD